VFSRSDQRWIPVDPIRGIIRKRNIFEPASDNGPIRMVYVVGYEEGVFGILTSGVLQWANYQTVMRVM
jgi:hypothetical protein